MSEEIVVYTKPGCPYCRRAIEELVAEGAAYREIDATAGAEAKAELQRVSGGTQVPVIVRGGRVELPAGGS